MKAIAFIICLALTTSTGFAQKIKRPLPDSSLIKNSITGFYKWYNENWKKVGGFKLYKSKSGKEGPPYLIDWREAERYFSYLRKNAVYLGEAFIENEKKIYRESEKDFRKYPEDELPSGFDYDHFTNTQEEPAYFLQELMRKDNHWTFTVLPQGTASVTINDKDGSAFFCGKMNKEKGIWKIANTQCTLSDTTISNQ